MSEDESTRTGGRNTRRTRWTAAFVLAPLLFAAAAVWRAATASRGAPPPQTTERSVRGDAPARPLQPRAAPATAVSPAVVAASGSARAAAPGVDDGDVAASGATAAERLASVRFRPPFEKVDAIAVLGELSTRADVTVDVTAATWDMLGGPGRMIHAGSRAVSGDEVLARSLGQPWRDAVAAGWIRVLEPGAPAPARDDPEWVRVPRLPAGAAETFPKFAVVVLDPEGRPFEGAELIDEALRRPAGRTDAAGAIALEARSWAHRMEYVVRAAGFLPSARVAIPRGVAPGDRVEVRLTRRAASVRGVVSGPDGRPVAGAAVAVIGLDDPAALRSYPRRWVRTGSDGRFEEPTAVPGAAVAIVFLEGCGTASVRLTARAGESAEVAVRIGKEASIRGVVRDDAGAPVADAMVHACADGYPEPFVWATSAADGTYRIGCLPAATVRVFVRDAPERAVSVTLAEGEARTLDVAR